MNRIEQAKRVHAEIQRKGRKCAVIAGAKGQPIVVGVVRGDGRPSSQCAAALNDNTLIGIYSPDCPVEWIAADLAAEGGALCAA